MRIMSLPRFSGVFPRIALSDQTWIEAGNVIVTTPSQQKAYLDRKEAQRYITLHNKLWAEINALCLSSGAGHLTQNKAFKQAEKKLNQFLARIDKKLAQSRSSKP